MHKFYFKFMFKSCLLVLKVIYVYLLQRKLYCVIQSSSYTLDLYV